MSKSGRSDLRPDLHRAHVKLDKLTAHGTVIIDKHGDAWQADRYGYWYRAFGGEGFTSHSLAQWVGDFKVIHEPKKTS